MCKYGSMLITGEGGISAEAIRFVLDLEDEDIKDKALVTHKIIVYLRTALDTKNKELIDGNKNNSFKS